MAHCGQIVSRSDQPLPPDAKSNVRLPRRLSPEFLGFFMVFCQWKKPRRLRKLPFSAGRGS